MAKLMLCVLAIALAASPSLAVTGQGKIWAVVTDQDGKPVPDAVVFEYDITGTFPPPEQPYIMDQIHKELVPHVLPILVGGKVRFPNKDDVHHDVYSFSPAKTFEIPLYKGEPAQPVVFDKPGPVQVGCNIHDWMSGIILVLPNPYFDKTEPDGKAVLLKLPTDRDMKIGVFHERLVGKVEDTLKTVNWASYDGKALRWTIQLKPDHRKKRPAIEY